MGSLLHFVFLGHNLMNKKLQNEHRRRLRNNQSREDFEVVKIM